jgi:transposase
MADCSRLSEAKFREVIKCFSVDLSATQIAQLTQLNLNTINKILTQKTKDKHG